MYCTPMPDAHHPSLIIILMLVIQNAIAPVCPLVQYPRTNMLSPTQPKPTQLRPRYAVKVKLTYIDAKALKPKAQNLGNQEMNQGPLDHARVRPYERCG